MDGALISQLVSNCIKKQTMCQVYIINRYTIMLDTFALRNPFCNMSKNDCKYTNHSDIQCAKFLFEFK